MHRAIFKTVLAISRDFWKIIAAILTIGISQTYIGMLALVFFQRLLDGLPGASSLADLTLPLAAYIGLNILNHLLVYAEGYPNSLLSQGVFQWVKLRALQKIERIDYQAYQDLGTGNLIQNIENGAAATRAIVTEFYLAVIRQVIPAMVISLGFIHYYDPTLFFIIIGTYGIFYLASYSLMRFLRQETERMLSSQERFSRFSVRAFMELVVFRVNGRFKAEYERARDISEEIVASRGKIFLLQELFFTGFALMTFIVQALVVIQQGSKIIAGASTIGTLVALIGFIQNVYYPISVLSMAWLSYRLNAVAFERFQTFFSLPDDPGLSRSTPLVIREGQVEFRGVCFAYGGGGCKAAVGGTGVPGATGVGGTGVAGVLRDFSLTIPGGKITALVGASGSGKSTLVRLLLHLLRPQAGKVLVDGQDLAEINLQDYYRAVAYIPQEPPIFDGTLRENLLFDRPVPAERLETALRQAGLQGLARSLPRGLDTLVGERGVKLSGGERQRVAFGRVLLQDPAIVILDEPTSALDSLTEDDITRELMPFLKGKTVIIVAHRLQTVRGADQIVALADGAIAQQGTFDALAREPGLFREMWEAQARAAG